VDLRSYQEAAVSAWELARRRGVIALPTGSGKTRLALAVMQRTQLSALCQYDSRLEERFAREFRRVAPDWDLLREPEPIAAEGALIFPDFALQHRSDPSRRWLLEIVGF
jgi:predicted nuclease of restriction endonuclease-like RecB superfamily